MRKAATLQRTDVPECCHGGAAHTECWMMAAMPMMEVALSEALEVACVCGPGGLFAGCFPTSKCVPSSSLIFHMQRATPMLHDHDAVED